MFPLSSLYFICNVFNSYVYDVAAAAAAAAADAAAAAGAAAAVASAAAPAAAAVASAAAYKYMSWLHLLFTYSVPAT